MPLLQLISVIDSWRRCTECAHLTRPAIKAYNRADHSTGYHCFRCYQILQAVHIGPFDR